MKKRFIVLFVLILTIVSLTFPIGILGSSADVQWKELGTLTFDGLEGNETTSTSTNISVTNDLFKYFGLQGTGKITVIKEGDEIFARATATGTASSKFVALSGVFKESGPIQEYQITITYRVSENFTFNRDDKPFSFRLRGDTNMDHALFDKDADFSEYTSWKTETFTITAKAKAVGFWVFAYSTKDSYFDVKSITVSEKPNPVFSPTVEFDARNPKDVVIECDLKGNEIESILDYSEPASPKTLADTNYVIAENGQSITVKKEFLQTLKPGQKSIVFKISGVDYAVVINVLHSTVKDAPISLVTGLPIE